MKKIFLFSVLFLAIQTFAFADGFQDSQSNRTTIKEALEKNNNSYVTVQGNIIKRLSDDKYTFKDSTGTMTVEIDKDKWQGISASPKDKLELTGEIEREFNGIMLDVDSVRHILP